MDGKATSLFTVKNHLAQKYQPKSIWGSTSQMNFAIPTRRSYNTLEVKKRKTHFTELSRSPLLEAAAVTELPMPAGTANPKHLLKCNHNHKAAPVWLWLLTITKIKLLTVALRGQSLSKGHLGYTDQHYTGSSALKSPVCDCHVPKSSPDLIFSLYFPCRTLCGTPRPCRPHQCSAISCCSLSSARLEALAGGTGGGGWWWCSTGGRGGAPGRGTGPPGPPGWSPRGAASPSLTSTTAWWACLTRWWGWGNTRAPTASCQVRAQPSARWLLTAHRQTHYSFILVLFNTTSAVILGLALWGFLIEPCFAS